jgi:hypothetical protein
MPPRRHTESEHENGVAVMGYVDCPPLILVLNDLSA